MVLQGTRGTEGVHGCTPDSSRHVIISWEDASIFSTPRTSIPAWRSPSLASTCDHHDWPHVRSYGRAWVSLDIVTGVRCESHDTSSLRRELVVEESTMCLALEGGSGQQTTALPRISAEL